MKYHLHIYETYYDGTVQEHHHRFLWKWVRDLVAMWYREAEDDYCGESPVIKKVVVEPE